MTPDEERFVERMSALDERISWIRVGSNGSDRLGTLPTNDFVWHSRGGIEVEHKALAVDTPIDIKRLTRQIRNAMAKNKRRWIVSTVVLDLGTRSLPSDVALALADYNRVAVRRPTGLWVMSATGLSEVVLKERVERNPQLTPGPLHS